MSYIRHILELKSQPRFWLSAKVYPWSISFLKFALAGVRTLDLYVFHLVSNILPLSQPVSVSFNAPVKKALVHVKQGSLTEGEGTVRLTTSLR